MSADVSIIIPAYNLTGYIQPCLNSITNQIYTDFEVIFVNDGSTDGTGAILDVYAAGDSRVRVIHQPNGGVSAARNAGMRAATGEYVLFFDGDDFFEPETVGELLACIQESNADALVYGYHRCRDGAVTETCPPVFAEGLYEGGTINTNILPRFVGFSNDAVKRWLAGEPNALYVENPALWRCMARADVIKRNGLEFDTNLKIGEDTIFITDLLSCCERCYVSHKFYYYLVSRESSAIALYEGNAGAKLDGKRRLLTARGELTARVLRRGGPDITPHWQGTVVMSVLELAFLFAKQKPFRESYHAFASYARSDGARAAVGALTLKMKPSLKTVPLLMLKRGWYPPLFICAWVLNVLRYEFDRLN